MKVKFEFRKHRQALKSYVIPANDVFVGTVTSVHLFVFDAENGDLVFEKTDKAENLVDGCIMPVDLDPGKYTFVAWCGLDSNDENNAFKLQHSYTRAAGDKCAIKMINDSEPVHDKKYEAVYHGITRDFTVTNYNMGTEIPVLLTKDTNDIHVWIQHTGKKLSKDEYEVVFTDANGEMDFTDNSLVSEDKTLTYKSHKTEILETETEYNGDKMESGALIAHLSVSRLLESHSATARIAVRDKEGKEVFSVPFIKYVLQIQDDTDDNQYYLDCEDTYNCSFYFNGVTPDGTWIPFNIIVNNWVVVPDQNEEI